jgi:hypothetical protein
VPDGLHLKEGGNAVDPFAALAVKGIGAILHSVWATCDTGDMLRGTLLRLNKKFVGAAPQVIPIDIGMAYQMRQEFGAARSDDVDDPGGDVAHGECFGQGDGGEWC